MRMLIKLIIVFIIINLVLFAACAVSSQTSPTPNIYWEGSGDLIETNDIARLQKELPFAMILPEYLPDKFESYKFNMLYHKIGEFPTLKIEYYQINPNEINIMEGPPQDGYPRPLPPGLFAKIHPGYNSIELAGIEVLEKQVYGTVLRNTKNIEVSTYYYIWENNNLNFSCGIYGYDQIESRKIIESMIK